MQMDLKDTQRSIDQIESVQTNHSCTDYHSAWSNQKITPPL